MSGLTARKILWFIVLVMIIVVLAIITGMIDNIVVDIAFLALCFVLGWNWNPVLHGYLPFTTYRMTQEHPDRRRL